MLIRPIYNIVYFILLFVGGGLFLLINPRRAVKELKKSFFQRIGFYPKFSRGKPALILRCASLGEAKIAAKISDALKDYPLIISVGTVSAYEYAEKNGFGDIVVFTPPDIYPLTKNFFRHFKSQNLILIESELWPELLWSAKDLGVKVFLVNGRFSMKTVSAVKRLRWLLNKVVKNVDYFFVRYPSDRDSLKLVNVPEEKIMVTGNIKNVYETHIPLAAREDFGLKPSDFIITAGSTHKEDEKVIRTVFGDLKEKYDDLKLIIVPRHVERADRVMRTFRDSAAMNFESDKRGFNTDKKCLVVERFGVLDKLYSISDVVLVGGSFGCRGGQDPVEAAYFSKPVIFGPNMKNFAYESEKLLSLGAAFVVKTADELKERIVLLKEKPEVKKKMGENAKTFIETSSKKKTINRLLEMLK